MGKMVRRTVWRLLSCESVSASLLLCFAGPSYAQKWERLGPRGGIVISLAAGAKEEVFLGTADGHVFASRDAGSHWELRGHMGKRWDGVVQTLIVDGRIPGRIYAGVWNQDPAAGGGVFRSEDGGKTWSRNGLAGEAVRALAQSESAPDVFVAGTRTGVFRTRDAGKTWERISPAGDEELRNLDSMAIDPRHADVIYAGTYHLAWKTMDGGMKWSAIAAGMIDDSDVMSLAIDRSHPERIFASACSGIYRSGDGGVQWTKLQGIPYASRRTQQIAQDPENEKAWFAGTTEGLWRSTDGGENWERVMGKDAVVNAIAFSGARAALLAGTEEGILASADRGAHFAASDTGFSHRVVRALAVDGADRSHLLVSVEEKNELLESTDGGRHWRSMTAPAGAAARLFAVGDGWMAALRGGGAARFDRKSQKWKEVRFMEKSSATPGRNQRGRRGEPVERAVKPDVLALHAAGGRLVAGTSDGLWSGGLREGTMRRVTAGGMKRGVIDWSSDGDGATWFAVMESEIARSSDGGKTWDPTRAPDEAGDLLWARAEEGHPGKLLAGARKGVFEVDIDRPAGAGQNWRLLQNGLPAAAAWPGWFTKGYWVVAMREGGTYVSRNEGRSWNWVDDEGMGRVVALAGGERGRLYARTGTDGVVGLEEGSGNGPGSQNGTAVGSDSAPH